MVRATGQNAADDEDEMRGGKLVYSERRNKNPFPSCCDFSMTPRMPFAAIETSGGRTAKEGKHTPRTIVEPMATSIRGKALLIIGIQLAEKVRHTAPSPADFRSS